MTELISILDTGHVAAVEEDEVEVGYVGEGLGHRRDIHPVFTCIAVRLVACVSAVGPRTRHRVVSGGVVLDVPSRTMSPKHHSVAVGGIVGEGLPGHCLQYSRVAGECLLHGDGVGLLAITVIEQIWLAVGTSVCLGLIDIDRQTVAAHGLDAFLDLP